MSSPTAIYGRVALRKDLARSIRGGHPWVYRDAISSDRAIPDGAVVLVTSRDGRPIGRGFWSSTSPIAVRMLATDAAVDLELEVPTRLRQALDQRLTLFDLNATNAFRWVHGEADLLPGMHLDVYGARASVRFDGAEAAAFYGRFAEDILALGGAIGLASLVERRRASQSRRSGPGPGLTGPPESDERDPEPPGDGNARLVTLAGEEAPDGPFLVRENGLTFEVDLLHGQKGGLFLDQRDNRQWVRQHAAHRRVLNLFGYTGGFSVYAAAGGAAETTTVDLSPGAVAAARKNLMHNQLPVQHGATLVVSDAFAFLAAARKRGQTWDLVISDPPSFAPRQSALPEALRAYRRLHQACAAVTAPGGILCAASCSSHVGSAAFVDSVEAGCADAGRRFTLKELRGAGADHPVVAQFPEGSYLKFAAGLVG
jgi:23S rRNA (cytosine1962-C5)-methyltransferase